MIVQNKKSTDPLRELARMPTKLYTRMFRRCDFFYSETTRNWACTIEYGFGYRIFGTGKSPHRALVEAIKQIDKVIERTEKEEDNGS